MVETQRLIQMLLEAGVVVYRVQQLEYTVMVVLGGFVR
jgi:hypothetical protein